MNFYCFHQWLNKLSCVHKYLYILLMTYVVLLTVIIGATFIFIGPLLLGIFVNPWLGFVSIVTTPLGVLLVRFMCDLFDM